MFSQLDKTALDELHTRKKRSGLESFIKIKDDKYLSTEKYHPKDFKPTTIYTDTRDIFLLKEDSKTIESFDPVEARGWLEDKTYILAKIYHEVFENPVENSMRFIKEDDAPED